MLGGAITRTSALVSGGSVWLPGCFVSRLSLFAPGVRDLQAVRYPMLQHDFSGQETALACREAPAKQAEGFHPARSSVLPGNATSPLAQPPASLMHFHCRPTLALARPPLLLRRRHSPKAHWPNHQLSLCLSAAAPRSCLPDLPCSSAVAKPAAAKSGHREGRLRPCSATAVGVLSSRLRDTLR